jgi:hypothetical protein
MTEHAIVPPDGVRVIDEGPKEAGFRDAPVVPRFRVIVRWADTSRVLKLIAIAVADAFVAVTGVMLYGGGVPTKGVLVFWAVACALAAYTYAFLCGVVNHTTIDGDPDGIVVRCGPLPWRGRFTATRREVVQVAVLDAVRMYRGKQRSITYGVVVKTSDGAEHGVVTGVADLDRATFVAAALRDRLGIPRL